MVHYGRRDGRSRNVPYDVATGIRVDFIAQTFGGGRVVYMVAIFAYARSMRSEDPSSKNQTRGGSKCKCVSPVNPAILFRVTKPVVNNRGVICDVRVSGVRVSYANIGTEGNAPR